MKVTEKTFSNCSSGISLTARRGHKRFFGRALSEQAAAANHQDPIRQGKHLGDVVRDIDHRNGEFVAHARQIRQDFFLEADIERGQRLVEQQQLRARQDRAGKRDALRLAAGKFGHRPGQEMSDLENFEHVFHADAFGAGSVNDALGAEENISPHRKVREQSALLGHVADVSALRRKIDFPRRGKERFAADLDFTRRDIAQAGDGVEQRRFAGARRAEDRRHARIEGRRRRRARKSPAVCGSRAACYVFFPARSSHSEHQTNRNASATVMPSTI